MTKMAAMPIYGKNPSKIFFSETNRLISRKLGVKHRWLKYFNVYINHDPVMTLTKFMARSTWVAYAFELGKLLKCHLKGKASRKLANGQNIEDSEKRKWPKGFICPCTGIKYHNIHTCLLTSICSRSQVSVYRTIGPLVFTSLPLRARQALINKVLIFKRTMRGSRGGGGDRGSGHPPPLEFESFT